MLREFGADLAKSLGAWPRAPMLPILTLFLQVPYFWFLVTPEESPQYLGVLGFVALTLWIFTGGFLGTQRRWYVAAWSGDRLSPAEVRSLSLRYLPRFIFLGLFTGFPFFVAQLSLQSVLNAIVDDRLMAATITTAVVGIAWDVWLTFMPPALVFSTEEPAQAMSVGWRMLKRLWPRTAVYALVPPVGLQLVWWEGGRTRGAVLHITVWMIAALFALACKGATAAFYLRHHHAVTDEMDLKWSGPPVEVPEHI